MSTTPLDFQTLPPKGVLSLTPKVPVLMTVEVEEEDGAVVAAALDIAG